MTTDYDYIDIPTIGGAFIRVSKATFADVAERNGWTKAKESGPTEPAEDEAEAFVRLVNGLPKGVVPWLGRCKVHSKQACEPFGWWIDVYPTCELPELDRCFLLSELRERIVGVMATYVAEAGYSVQRPPDEPTRWLVYDNSQPPNCLRAIGGDYMNALARACHWIAERPAKP